MLHGFAIVHGGGVGREGGGQAPLLLHHCALARRGSLSFAAAEALSALYRRFLRYRGAALGTPPLSSTTHTT